MIESIVPIELKDLKKYFEDKTETYLLDYENSTLKGAQFLTYLSNLDIPCDIKNMDEELISEYLKSQMLVSIPKLEKEIIAVLFEHKGLTKTDKYKSVIEENKEILDKWAGKLESLPLYNMSIVGEGAFNDFVESYPKDETEDVRGINFVSLLKHKEFYSYYQMPKENVVKNYTKYFKEYMFKGKSLFEYWANASNPLFLMTWAVAEGKFDSKEYNKRKMEGVQNLPLESK